MNYKFVIVKLSKIWLEKIIELIRTNLEVLYWPVGKPRYYKSHCIQLLVGLSDLRILGPLSSFTNFSYFLLPPPSSSSHFLLPPSTLSYLFLLPPFTSFYIHLLLPTSFYLLLPPPTSSYPLLLCCVLLVWFGLVFFLGGGWLEMDLWSWYWC